MEKERREERCTRRQRGGRRDGKVVGKGRGEGQLVRR